jgi:hypothetical protein
MCDKIISRLTAAARTYGQSLATVIRVTFELEPDISDLAEIPVRWVATLRIFGSDLVDGSSQQVMQRDWQGSGESIKDALIVVGKSLRDHINGELFVNRQKCADSEMAIREMERDIGDIWTEPVEAEQALEKAQE